MWRPNTKNALFMMLCLMVGGCGFGFSKRHIMTVDETENCTYRPLWPKLDRGASVFTAAGALSATYFGSLTYSNSEHRDGAFTLFGVGALAIIMSISHYRSSVYGYEQIKRCRQFREEKGTLPPEKKRTDCQGILCGSF